MFKISFCYTKYELIRFNRIHAVLNFSQCLRTPRRCSAFYFQDQPNSRARLHGGTQRDTK